MAASYGARRLGEVTESRLDEVTRYLHLSSSEAVC